MQGEWKSKQDLKASLSCGSVPFAQITLIYSPYFCLQHFFLTTGNSRCYNFPSSLHMFYVVLTGAS